jgi:mannose-6-phosphate isomerase-like protein (cupin superfamily)
MEPKIIKASSLMEYLTPERCFIYENCGFSTGNSEVSIARARVEPSVTTKAHHLEGIQEIYIITDGAGKVQIGDSAPAEVSKGDVVIIPAGISQKITNTGKTDLIFYCVCTPAFTEKRYVDEETENAR